MRTAIRLLAVGFVAMFAIALAVADEKKERNLAANGGFEEVKAGAPVGWASVCSDGGTVTHKAVADGAKEGKYCLAVRSKADWAVAYSPKVKIDRAKTYTLTGFVRVKAGSTATIKIDYYKGDEYLGHSESEQTTKAEWTQLTVSSELDSYKDATHLLVAGVVHEDGEAFFDRFELVAK
jgi:hypothetical protein